jgi:hypothetical protein
MTIVAILQLSDLIMIVQNMKLRGIFQVVLDISRVYQELYEKYCLALQNNKSNNADNINKPENKEDNIKNLLRKICTAYQVLSEKQVVIFHLVFKYSLESII